MADKDNIDMILHDIDADNDDVVATFNPPSAAAIEGVYRYYVYCVNEGKRIGRFDTNSKVVNQWADHHSRTYGHSTQVRSRSD